MSYVNVLKLMNILNKYDMKLTALLSTGKVFTDKYVWLLFLQVLKFKEKLKLLEYRRFWKVICKNTDYKEDPYNNTHILHLQMQLFCRICSRSFSNSFSAKLVQCFIRKKISTLKYHKDQNRRINFWVKCFLK